MTARPIRRNAQTPDRNGKIFYTSTTSLSHISKYSEFIGNGILKDFLTNNRNEVRSMSLFEFDAEEHEKAIKQIAYEEGELDGAARGEQVGRIKMLYELGNTIPEIAVKLNISEESVKDIIKA